MTSRPRLRPLKAVVLALVAACTTAPAAIVTTTAPPVTTTTVVLSVEQATAQFQVCLNGHGIDAGEIPLGDDGRADLSSLAEGLGDDLSGLREALTDCSAVLAASGALDLSTEPVLRAAVLTQLTNFSICMRSLGVETFPDPDPDFDGTGPPFAITSLPVSDPEFGAAIEGCASAVGVNPLRR